MEKQKLSREEIAKIEIGHTEISRGQQLVLSLLFLALIVLYPVAQICYETRNKPLHEIQELQLGNRLIAAPPDQLGAALKSYETALEDCSLLRAVLLKPAQEFLTGVFSSGNEKVIVGSDGWLFYASDFNYLANPGFLRPERLYKRKLKGGQPDPVRAILDFQRQLKARGIRLILLPAPVKPMLYGDKLGGNAAAGTVLQNPSFGEFRLIMEANDITVLDLAPEFALLRTAGTEPYLKTDTHWTPEGMEIAAAELAELVSERKTQDHSTPQQITHLGDIAAMLKLSMPEKFFAAETVSVRPRQNFRVAPNSPVLLLGDSFNNIYSVPAMNWGEKSGLAERLSAYLGYNIDVIARNDAGAFATRELLSNELRRGRDRLAGKKIVIYEFAIRELADGNWKMLDLSLGDAPEVRFLALDAPRRVTATVQQVSVVPQPHSAPYKDHIMSVYFVDVNGGNEQALVYIKSMVDNVWTPAAQWRPGDRVTLMLMPWSGEAEAKFGSWNRSDLDDEELLLQEPLWGELK